MAPLIEDGDLLVIRHGNQDIQLGDVLVFRTHRAYCAHRVVRIMKKWNGKDSFLMKGDARTSFDPPVEREQVLGKVVAVEGSRKRMDLEASYWKAAGYAVAVLSYVDGCRFRKDSVLWKGANSVFDMYRRLFHGNCANKRDLLNGILRMSR
jgi:hypothetical protein